jgi:hypothetical protein
MEKSTTWINLKCTTQSGRNMTQKLDTVGFYLYDILEKAKL